jgi:FkbM family methyltransferase
LSSADIRGEEGDASLPDERRTAPDIKNGRIGSGKGDRVRFDHRNILLHEVSSPHSIEVVLSVPLEDGAVAETRISLASPARSIQKSGGYEYTMDINTNLQVTKPENPTGQVGSVQRDGISWELPFDCPGAGTALLLHEPKVKEFLTSHFKQGKVFVDVGANVGGYSVRAAAAGMKVHAFEPNPDNTRALRRNAEINGLSIDVVECALGASDTTASLIPNGAVSRITEEGGIDVAMRALDGFELATVDLMKVDVEGYELEVLRGATQTLRRCHPTLIIEMHHWAGAESEAELFEILSHLEYRFEYLDRYALGRHLTAEYLKKTVNE